MSNDNPKINEALNLLQFVNFSLFEEYRYGQATSKVGRKTSQHHI